MKKLQSNFTTPEQSKRLLELGVPADSADCIMRDNEHVYKYNFDMEPTMTQLIKRLNTDDYRHRYIPCWSVGRLMEIYKIVGEEAGQCVSCSKNQTQVESLVQLYEENIELLDFSKLEE